jgi:hypothetical protein
MDNEMSGMLSQNVFVMEHLPDGATVIAGRWVYSYKCGPDGGIKSYNARWPKVSINSMALTLQKPMPHQGACRR